MTTSTRRQWTKAELLRARELRIAGVPVSEVAVKLGRSKVSVVNALSYHRVKGVLPFDKRLRSNLTDYKKRLVSLHARGLSDQEIATLFGVRRDTVRLWRNRLGLPANTLKYDWQARYRRQMANAGVRSLVEMRWSKREEAGGS